MDRARLESHGITAFVHGEHLAALDVAFPGPSGGVRLEVPAPEAEAAHAILSGPPEEAAPARAGAPIPVDDVHRCPACGTETAEPIADVEWFGGARRLARRIGIGRWVAPRRCRVCNHVW